MSKESRLVVDEEELHSKIASGVEKVYKLAKAGYGPGAGNVMIEQKYGDPLLSRDGVTNIRRLYLEDPVENMAARAVIQASSMNNRNVGDGTTAAAMLTYLLYKEARKLVVAGYGRMEVARRLRQVQYSVVEQVEALAKPFTKKMLLSVAKTSTGDEAIAQMLDEVFAELGEDAGVLVESYAGADVSSEVVSGFYFEKGWTKVGLTNQPSNLRSYHEGSVPILVSEKRLLTKADIGPILAACVKDGVSELILVGEVSDEVIEVLAANWMSGVIAVVPVDPPYYEGMRTLFMDDLALLIDADVYAPGASGEEFDVGMLGYADKVVIDERSTKIVGGDGLDEAVEDRIAELKRQLKAASSPQEVDALRQRISKLTGKLAIIRVGGATDLEREELKLRVDDAVSAIRAAFRTGVVPGGGVTLARVKVDDFGDSYQGLIKALAENSGFNPETISGRATTLEPWFGYDFADNVDAPVSLMEVGILDPTQVVTEIVKNATSIAASLITASAGSVFVDREAKLD